MKFKNINISRKLFFLTFVLFVLIFIFTGTILYFINNKSNFSNVTNSVLEDKSKTTVMNTCDISSLNQYIVSASTDTTKYNLSDTFLSSDKKFQSYVTQKKSSSELEKAAYERKKSILSGLDSIPDVMYKNILGSKTKDLQLNLNTGCIEKLTSVEGKLEIETFDNSQNIKSSINYFLRQSNTDRIQMFFTRSDLIGFRPGDKLKITGYSFGSFIVIDNLFPKNITKLPAAVANNNYDSNIVLNQPGIKLSANTTLVPIQKKIAVIKADFQNIAHTAARNNAYFTNTVLSKVKDYYTKSSYGKLNLTFDFYNGIQNYVLPVNNDCILNTISNVGELEAIKLADPNIDYSQYEGIIFLFPGLCRSNATIGKISVTTDDGTFDLSLSRDYFDPSASQLDDFEQTTHEFGHNLGLYHSSFINCDFEKEIISTHCLDNLYNPLYNPRSNSTDWRSNNVLINYGDPYDVMAAGDGDLNIIKKEYLSWLDDSNIKDVTSQDGIYELAPLSAQTLGVKGLKIKYLSDQYDYTPYMYFEFRQPIPSTPDASLSNIASGNYMGLMVRVNFNQSNASGLIDTIPRTDQILTPIKIGDTFTIPTTGAKIKLLSIQNASNPNTARAIVSVTNGKTDFSGPVASIDFPSVPDNGGIKKISGVIQMKLTANDPSGISCINVYENYTSSKPTLKGGSLPLASLIGNNKSNIYPCINMDDTPLQPGNDQVINIDTTKIPNGVTIFNADIFDNSGLTYNTENNRSSAYMYADVENENSTAVTGIIFSPKNNDLVVNPFEIKINLSDVDKVAKVEYYTETSSYPSYTVSYAPFDLKMPFSKGEKYIMAKIYNFTNVESDTNTVNFTVNNNPVDGGIIYVGYAYGGGKGGTPPIDPPNEYNIPLMPGKENQLDVAASCNSQYGNVNYAMWLYIDDVLTNEYPGNLDCSGGINVIKWDISNQRIGDSHNIHISFFYGNDTVSSSDIRVNFIAPIP